VNRMSVAFRSSSFYSRLRNSWVQDAYWRMADRQIIDRRAKQVEFYRDLLKGFRDGDLIFDVGANVGEKADVFLRIGACVVAVEPDIRAQDILRAKFLKYRLSPKPVKIIGKAVSDNITVETMWIDGPGSALNTLSRKWADALRESRENKERFDTGLDALEFANMRQVETTTIEQLITEHGSPFFVKIDVEGHELSALRGLRRPVPFLSFEVNLPEFRSEGVQCLDLLRELAPAGECNFTPDCSSGLSLERWVDTRQMKDVIDHCQEACIEVFWRNPLTPHEPRAAANGH
jgi:FkbM family methyltransferase